MATNDTGPGSAPALLREVARLHVRAQRATLACDAVGNTSCTILTELGRAPAMTLAELARRLRLDKSWTSRAVDQLVAEKLVAKATSDTDRRTINLSLTRAGRAEHRRLDALLNAQVNRVLDRVPTGDRANVTRALRLLLEAYAVELAETPLSEAGTLCTVQ
jgi:DNA-binding MarR family transcriptional regulator